MIFPAPLYNLSVAEETEGGGLLGKSAVVIGSGVGGAAAAALLAGKGLRVTLLEGQDFLGGRCASLERDGFRYDFGVHMFSRGPRGPLGEVGRRVKGRLRWVLKDRPCRVMGRAEFTFPLDIRPLARQAELAGNLGVKPRNLPGAFLLIRSLLAGRGAGTRDGETVRSFASRYTDDQMVHLFLNCLCQLYFALSYGEASAGEFAWCFSRMFNDASFGYPAGGGGAIPSAYVDGLRRLGGEVRLGERVRSLGVEEGRVKSVGTDREEYPADLVVSNAGLKATLALAGPENFPPEYVRAAEGMRDSNAYVTIKYALERPVVDAPVVFYMPEAPAASIFDYVAERRPPDDPYIFMPVPSNWDPSLAPQGRQLVIAGTAAPCDASEELCGAILDRVDRKVRELFPALQDQVMWQVRSSAEDTRGLTGHGSGECIGLAQVPGQVGKDRPSHRTPVEGLWLVGADAGARGIGTEMAAGSALGLLDVLVRSGVA
jgi:prolycopene isomerase